MSLGRHGTVLRQPKPLGAHCKCWSVSWEAWHCFAAAEALGGSVEVLECLLGDMALFAAVAKPLGAGRVPEGLLGDMALACGCG